MKLSRHIVDAINDVIYRVDNSVNCAFDGVGNAIPDVMHNIAQIIHHIKKSIF